MRYYVAKDGKIITVWGYLFQAISSAIYNKPAVVVNSKGRVLYRSYKEGK